MRKPGGYAIICEPGQADRECDTFTCGHCSRVVHVKVGARPEDIGGLCKVCMKLICGPCVGHVCVPLEKRIEAEEARYHALRSYGLAG